MMPVLGGVDWEWGQAARGQFRGWAGSGIVLLPGRAHSLLVNKTSLTVQPLHVKHLSLVPDVPDTCDWLSSRSSLHFTFFCWQEFWKQLGNLGVLGITAPGEYSFLP